MSRRFEDIEREDFEREDFERDREDERDNIRLEVES